MELLLAAEVAFVLAFLAGVALLSLPWALILGGLIGAVAMERASALARRSRPAPASDDRLRRVV